MSRNIFLALAILLAPTATIGCDDDPECGDPTPWSEFSQFELTVTYEGYDQEQNWTGLFDNAIADARIEVYSGSPKVHAGTIGLVNGAIMLSKGMTLEPGYEIDALDAPVLNFKLVAIILSRLYPGGPNTVQQSQELNYQSEIGIKFATQSASGYIAAPWSVTGALEKSEDGSAVFDITLRYPITDPNAEVSSESIRMRGTLGFRKGVVFEDSEPLVGWTVYGLGPRTTKNEGGTAMDYGASRRTEESYKVLGDIREHIAKQNHPGEPDSTKDFTGFWKSHCEEAFGLSIEHIGTEGMYSVVFCGPGGCGDPGSVRPTYVTGDHRYKVLSENQIEELRGSGDSTTYIRCTSNPRPALKYKE